MPDASILVQALQQACKLDLNQAKTAMYWRLGANWITDENVKFYPALGLIGPSGSGKSTIEEAQYAVHPESCHKFSLEGATPAVTRDELEIAFNKIAVIDEFDMVSDVKAAARFIQARCSRATASILYKNPAEHYKAKTVNMWGATVYHIRNAPEDPALVSRSIMINTRQEDPPFIPFDVTPETYRAIFNSINWTLPRPVDGMGRMFDTWNPILWVGQCVGDEEWVAWVNKKLALLQQRLKEAAGFDHKQVVLARIIEIVANRTPSKHPFDGIWDRIAVHEEIGLPIQKDLLAKMTPWQVAEEIKSLGFKTERRAGKLWLYPSPSSVILAADSVRYEDEWLATIRHQDNFGYEG